MNLLTAIKQIMRNRLLLIAAALLLAVSAAMAQTATDDTDADGTAYAAYCAGNNTLYFFSINNTDAVPVKGSTYANGTFSTPEITDLWSGEEVTNTASLPSFDPEHYGPGWRSNDEYRTNIYNVVFDGSFGKVKPQTCASWFEECTNLKSVEGMVNLNTSNAADMRSMFRACASLQSLDLGSLNTSRVTDMSYMFNGCINLATLDISRFDTKSVTNMNHMFCRCEKLTELNLSSFDTQNVTNMESMFSYCNKLAELDLSNFNTAKVSTMVYMFEGCNNLTKLNISNFETPELTNMSWMFSDCNKLTELDLGKAYTPKVGNMTSMFKNCKSLKSLDVRKFYIAERGLNGTVFTGCDNLMTIDLREATGNIGKYANYPTFAKRGMIIIVPSGTAAENVSAEENYIVMPGTGTSYVRTFTAGNMSTVCLPYAVDASSVTGGTLYEFDCISDGGDEVTFTPVTGITSAGKAYLFKPSTDEQVTFAGTTVMTDLPADITEDAAPGLYGTYAGKTFTAADAAAGIYFGWSQGSFWRAGEGAKVAHNRAYLKAPGVIPARLMVRLDGEATGIQTVPASSPEASAATTATAYDLNGQRVSSSYKGIVIRNGKKMMLPLPASPKGR